jgi:hypothetical protein
MNSHTPDQKPLTANAELPAPSGVVCSDLLCVNEQQVILDRARHKMRDLECQYRKDADSWHKQGAKAQAQLCAYMADAIDQAIRELLKAETEYRNAKNANYA